MHTEPLTPLIGLRKIAEALIELVAGGFQRSRRVTGKPDIAVQLLTVWLPDIRHHAAPGDVVGGLAS